MIWQPGLTHREQSPGLMIQPHDSCRLCPLSNGVSGNAEGPSFLKTNGCLSIQASAIPSRCLGDPAGPSTIPPAPGGLMSHTAFCDERPPPPPPQSAHFRYHPAVIGCGTLPPGAFHQLPSLPLERLSLSSLNPQSQTRPDLGDTYSHVYYRPIRVKIALEGTAL